MTKDEMIDEIKRKLELRRIGRKMGLDMDGYEEGVTITPSLDSTGKVEYREVLAYAFPHVTQPGVFKKIREER